MRTHSCDQINSALTGETITLCGFVHRRRDHGGLVFVDLRDRNSMVQVVTEPEQAEAYDIAQELRNEFVIQVKGQLRPRPKGMVNANLASGEVELVAERLTILNRADVLPIQIDDYKEVGEETRLKYRYLDLRRPEMAKKIKLRAAITRYIRNFLDEKDFLDIETPCLTKATPEGARDYLVPSRTHQGQFFALPQSPQIFKELLMIAGFERYYQIVKCFRDEDLRADRQPEFTQLDIEMAFVEESDIQNMMEDLFADMFKTLIDVDLPKPFKRIPYADAMSRYGSDKPDLRIPIEMVTICDIIKNVDFKVFSGPANDKNCKVAAMLLKDGVNLLTRKNLDDYQKFVGIYGAKGLAYIKVNDLDKGMDGLQSPILKFLPEDVAMNIIERMNAKTGDIIFFGADTKKIVNEALGALRSKLGEDLNLYTSEWAVAWVTDFPMFEKGNDGSWQALHHPFTAPSENNVDALKADPGASASRAYDLVLNGFELGGGSIRIHDLKLQLAALDILGIDEKEAYDQFGHLLNALRFGCPPLGGIAFGIDRIAMLMTKSSSIREVIAFPKTQSAACPLTNAPSHANDRQLQELGIKVKKPQTDTV
jgi:aspartyl-tRNA synthetase